MDRAAEMTAFVTAVENGGFSAAARTLGLTPSALSKLVSRLEDRLGARLLHRTTRRLSLTEAGQLYLERSRQILEELEDADSAVGLTTARAVGRLKVNAPLSFGVQHLAPLWGAFLATRKKPPVDGIDGSGDAGTGGGGAI